MATRISRLLGLGFLLLTIGFASWLRIHTTLTDPNFLTDRPDGLLRADPGLLFYLQERVIDGHGLPPPDFRADPRVEYPGLTDLPALDSVFQEFPIAWAYLLAGHGMPLHVFCLCFTSIVAALMAVGVYFLVLELTGAVLWACLAVALFAVTEANYRTLGWVLMREDFSLPFFALHLALLARAARRRTPSSMVLCGLALAAALASWHAMGFITSLELLCLFLWYLRTGENPFAVPYAWIVPAIVGGVSLGVPVLARTHAILGLPMSMAAGLLVAAFLERRHFRRAGAAAAALATVIALGLLAGAVAGGAGDYTHVWELLRAKLRYLGEIPADPNVLSFDARAMWQGPFLTLGLELWNRFFGMALWLFIPVLVVEGWGWMRGAGRSAERLLAGFCAVGLVGTWLIGRLMVLPGILLPVCAALFLARFRARQVGVAVMGAALLWQGIAFARIHGDYQILWYQPPIFFLGEYRAMLAALPALVPENEAVMADPVVSTAILAHTRRPIILQPKWEEAEARRRLQDFVLTLFHGSPEDLRRLMLEKYRCRYLLVDRWTVWKDLRWLAGFRADQQFLVPGTAASIFLGTDPDALASVPGYRLLYRSPLPTDTMRLYQLVVPEEHDAGR